MGLITVEEFLIKENSFPHGSKEEIYLDGYDVVKPVVDHAHVHV